MQFEQSQPRPATGSNILTFGTGVGPNSMDPQFAYDSGSINVLQQVCEGLYFYNVSLPGSPLEPLLATGYTLSTNKTVYTFTLRQGVTFQDGTPFNASAAKWNFDRLAFFYNATGTLPSMVLPTQFAGDFLAANGTCIINSTKVVSNYVLNVTLNMQYGAFIDLLCFNGLWMLSPYSTTACGCARTYLQFSDSSAKLIGTGPFEFVQYKSNDFVELKANPDYWQGAPKIDEIIFDVNGDEQSENNDMLAKDYSIITDPLPTMISTFNTTSGLYLQNGPSTVDIDYIIFNTVFINETLRAAMTYAFNYNYMLTVILQNLSPRLHGPIPNGMPYYNASIPYVSTNNTKLARQFLISNATKNGLSWASAAAANINNDAWWTTKAASSSPIAEFNMSYNTDSAVRGEITQMAASNFAEIGVKIDITGTKWNNIIDDMFSAPNDLQIYTMNWVPDFNDPDYYCTWLYTTSAIPPAGANGPQLSDPVIDTWCNQAKFTANTTLRQELYNKIQYRLQEVDYPQIFTDQLVNYNVWVSNLTGYPSNKMGIVYFYPCRFTPDTPTAPQNLQAISGNGQVKLSWRVPASNGGSAITGYNIYRGTTSRGETFLINPGNKTNYTITSLTPGQTYWFIVQAVTVIGNGTNSTEQSATVPSVPSAPALTATAGNTQVVLTWTVPSNGYSQS